MKIIAARMAQAVACRGRGVLRSAQEPAVLQRPGLVHDLRPGDVQVLEGEDAIAKNRQLMGATDPKKAEKGTIRADFAASIDANAVHGSDAAETAAVEMAFFFAGMNVHAR